MTVRRQSTAAARRVCQRPRRLASTSASRRTASSRRTSVTRAEGKPSGGDPDGRQEQLRGPGPVGGLGGLFSRVADAVVGAAATVRRGQVEGEMEFYRVKHRTQMAVLTDAGDSQRQQTAEALENVRLWLRAELGQQGARPAFEEAVRRRRVCGASAEDWKASKAIWPGGAAQLEQLLRESGAAAAAVGPVMQQSPQSAPLPPPLVNADAILDVVESVLGDQLVPLTGRVPVVSLMEAWAYSIGVRADSLRKQPSRRAISSPAGVVAPQAEGWESGTFLRTRLTSGWATAERDSPGGWCITVNKRNLTSFTLALRWSTSSSFRRRATGRIRTSAPAETLMEISTGSRGTSG